MWSRSRKMSCLGCDINHEQNPSVGSLGIDLEMMSI